MKDILVSLDTTDICKKRIDAALLLAEKFDSHITGIYQQQAANIALYADPMPQALLEAIDSKLEEEKVKMTEFFNDCVKLREAKCTLKIESSISQNNVLTQANLNDIVVAGQLNPDKHIYSEYHQPEHIIMGSGKPVLVIPYIGFPETMGDNIVIAWDQSREASRAIHDALPLLRKAKKVHIFSAVNRKQRENELVAVDMAEHLARHDINIDTNPTVLTDVPVAETLLSRCADYDADLIVMGAYGHSRLREYTLGGTTRTILKSMTLPVLMTH